MRECNIVFIKNKSFGNTWVELCKQVVENGFKYKTEYGNDAKYVTATIHLDRVAVKEIEKLSLHLQYPTKKLHLKKYLQEFTDQFDVQGSGFEYTYYLRLKKQLSMLCKRLDKVGSRRRVAITWIPSIDIKSEHPPCLIFLNMFNRNGKDIDLFLHFRSRDCFNAYQSNLCGIVYMVNNEILKGDRSINDYEELNELKISNIYEFIDNAHVYDYNWRDVEQLKYISVSPQERYY